MNKILIVPNPFLRKKALPINIITHSEIYLSKTMIKIMKKTSGIGLAATQLGQLKRIITVNIDNEKNKKDNSYALFNPEIVWYSKNKVVMEEGCLSVPKQFVKIERPDKIRIKYIDMNNKIKQKKADGLEARIIQHEVDHLEGKLFIDYLSSLKRKLIIKKVQKLVKMGQL